MVYTNFRSNIYEQRRWLTYNYVRICTRRIIYDQRRTTMEQHDREWTLGDFIDEEEKERIKVHLVHTWYDVDDLSGWVWYTDDDRRCARTFRTIEQCNDNVLEQPWFNSNYEVEWHVYTLHKDQIQNTKRHIILQRIEAILNDHFPNHPINVDVIEYLSMLYTHDDLRKMFLTPDGSILVDVVLDFTVTFENITCWAFQKFQDQLDSEVNNNNQ